MKSLLDLFGPAENLGISAKLLFCWRPRRDLNPCYRRESYLYFVTC